MVPDDSILLGDANLRSVLVESGAKNEVTPVRLVQAEIYWPNLADAFREDRCSHVRELADSENFSPDF
ncbi:hypothetical protein GCM10011574_47990 [Microbispora bryophytorum]|uniref:Uncharacterized protein n=1 Tax=Microbispora bryophytorum TaxID=1460882 RepID=A0A8H9LI82_9ACTN|nr:hypothetical protein GCM10011574_47990 [Microbispora bryophytorum]